MMYKNFKKTTPNYKDVIPSMRQTERSSKFNGSSLDKFFRDLDRENMLREVSKYPADERKKLLEILRRQSHTRS